MLVCAAVAVLFSVMWYGKIHHATFRFYANVFIFFTHRFFSGLMSHVRTLETSPPAGGPVASNAAAWKAAVPVSASCASPGRGTRPACPPAASNGRPANLQWHSAVRREARQKLLRRATRRETSSTKHGKMFFLKHPKTPMQISCVLLKQ